MRLYISVLCAWLALAAAVRADEFTDCNASCDFATRMRQCARVAARTDVPSTTKALALARICASHIKARVWDHTMYDACTKAVELDPSAGNYNSLGAAKIAIGAYKSAIKTLDVALRINPALSEAYYNRALAFEQRGNRHEALADLKQALLLGDQSVRPTIKKLVRPKLPTRRD